VLVVSGALGRERRPLLAADQTGDGWVGWQAVMIKGFRA
jgi:hypothetical protein